MRLLNLILSLRGSVIEISNITITISTAYKHAEELLNRSAIQPIAAIVVEYGYNIFLDMDVKSSESFRKNIYKFLCAFNATLTHIGLASSFYKRDNAADITSITIAAYLHNGITRGGGRWEEEVQFLRNLGRSWLLSDYVGNHVNKQINLGIPASWQGERLKKM